ncbi:MAG: 2-keto-4-pentenoate hydratase [Pseudomonadota bacterium]|nr:2-keto-4-pentenoate hydratase [Pseudomonadota bacterium]
MLTTAQRDEAARHLLAARRARQPGPRLPDACRPNDLEDALSIQRRVQELLGVATGGWKSSLPTAGRAIACAAIFAPTIVRASPCPVIARDGIVRIEPEVAFVLGRDLPPRAAPYSEPEVRAAIAETRLVLELLDSRYANPAGLTFPELLADQVSNQGLFVGPILRDAFSRPLEQFPIAIEGPAGALHRCEGRHPDGHPLRPLVWLANFLAARAETGALKAGQIVTTGSYAGALEVPVATPLAVRFGDLGRIVVEFVAI